MYPDPSQNKRQSPDGPNNEPKLNKHLDKLGSASPKASWILGSSLLLFLIVVFFFVPCLSPDRRGLVRFFMALAGGLIAFFFVGSMALRGKAQSLAISATGGAVIFILIQFIYNPFPSANCGDDSGRSLPIPTVTPSISPAPVVSPTRIRIDRRLLDDREQQITKLQGLIAEASEIEKADINKRKTLYDGWARRCGAALERIDQIQSTLGMNKNFKSKFDFIAEVKGANVSDLQLDKIILSKLAASVEYLKYVLASL